MTGKEKEKTEAEVWYQGHEPCMKGAYEETDLAGIFPAKISSAPVSYTHLIASMSCKAAVKGNMKLSYAEMDELINELLSLDNPYHCPHGRPTIIAMTKRELENKFKRIG